MDKLLMYFVDIQDMLMVQMWEIKKKGIKDNSWGGGKDNYWGGGKDNYQICGLRNWAEEVEIWENMNLRAEMRKHTKSQQITK